MKNKVSKIFNLILGIIISLVTIAILPLYYYGIINISTWQLILILGFAIGINMMVFSSYSSCLGNKNTALFFIVLSSLILLASLVLMIILAVNNSITLF